MTKDTRQMSAELTGTADPELLRSFIRAIPDMVWLKNPAGAYLICNSATERFFGKPESELVGQTDRDLFPPAVAERFRLRDQEAAAAPGPTRHTEWLTFPSDGHRVLIETVKTALRDSRGKTLGVLGVGRDATANKLAEQALKDRVALQEQLQRIAATLPGVIFSCRLRPDGTSSIPYASAALEEVCGIRPEDLPAEGSALWDYVHPEDAVQVRSQLSRITGPAPGWRGEFRVRHPRKGEVWVECRGTSALEADGSVLWSGFLTDISERKRMEAALQASESQLKEAQRLAGIGSWVWDLTCERPEWSEALKQLMGLDPAVPGLTLEELQQLHTADSWERLRYAIHQAVESGTPYELELEMVWPDGHRRWRIARAEAERDKNGHIVRLRGTSQDITEQKLADQKVRVALDELADIQAHAPVIFVVVDRDLRIRKLNEPAARYFGRPESHLLGLRTGSALGCLNSLVDPRGCGYGPSCGECLVRQAVLDALRNGVRHDEVEAWVPLLQGGEYVERCLLIFTSPIDDGEDRKALISMLDITDRKRAEQQLQASETRFRTVTENAPIAISSARRGRIAYANPAYLRMFGFPNAEALHDTSLLDRFAPDSRDVLQQAEGGAEGVGGSREFEAVGRRADGSEFPMLVALIGIPFVEGPMLVTFITDLTGLKQAERERMRVEQQFRQAQKMETVGRLAGGVAHDFNNLLTVINGYSKLGLAKLRPGDPLRDSLMEILKAGERAAGLTRQLLAFSRKQVLQPRVLNLNAAVQEMGSMLSRLMGEDVELRFQLSPEAPMVHADQHQLEQAILNLAVNARDAMEDGGQLIIETRLVLNGNHSSPGLDTPHRRQAVLVVKDTGTGIDEATRVRIFEPFFTTKESGKGTGLGLSMVQGIVEQSGGTIEVDSQPGDGTSFRIYLPALDDTPAELAGRDAAIEQLGNETILVVEDQEEVRIFAVAVLQAYGYRVVQAADPDEAIEICAREGEHIDLVLTDVVMPHITGQELAARLAKIRPGIRVMFMSGYIDNVRVGLLETEQFIQKPFSPEELGVKVRGILRPQTERAARILIADDEESIRAFLRAVLESAGYEVIEAADGQQAFRQALAGGVDLVITDLVMPEREGIETIQALRKEAPDLGIIAISGAFHGQFLKAAQKLGADAAIAKPVSTELLLAKVTEVLEVRRQARPRPGI